MCQESKIKPEALRKLEDKFHPYEGGVDIS